MKGQQRRGERWSWEMRGEWRGEKGKERRNDRGEKNRELGKVEETR